MQGTVGLSPRQSLRVEKTLSARRDWLRFESYGVEFSEKRHISKGKSYNSWTDARFCSTNLVNKNYPPNFLGDFNKSEWKINIFSQMSEGFSMAVEVEN